MFASLGFGRLAEINLSNGQDFVRRAKHFLNRKWIVGVQLPVPTFSPTLAYDFLIAASEPVIAFDVFDTLVSRTITPEHSKLLSCARLARSLGLDADVARAIYERRAVIENRLCRECYDLTGDLEFRFADVAAQLAAFLREQKQLPGGMSNEQVCELARKCELDAERAVLRPVDPMISLLRELKQRGKRCILVTDFYLPEAALRILIQPFDILDHVDTFFVSCDRGASKRSGRLYDLILEDLQVVSGDLLMIGDNEWSDYTMARQKGLRAAHVENRAKKAFYGSKTAKIDSTTTFCDKATTIVDRQSVKGEPNFQPMAASLLLFIERLFRELRARRRRHVFFLAREGQLLERMFNMYQDALGIAGDDRIATHYLIASRRSTYVASLQPLPQERFDRYFAQYAAVSLADFLSSLQIQRLDIEDICTQIGADPDYRETALSLSDVYASLRENSRFQEVYEQIRATQKACLNGYVKQFDVDFRFEPLSLVDVGWKGSIQDNLRGALPSEIDIEGFYLGLVAQGASSARKSGLLFSNIDGLTPFFPIFAENRSLFEVLLPANHGSALRYARDANGTFRVETEKFEDELVFVRTTVMPVAQKIMSAFADLCKLHVMHLLPERTMMEIVAGWHSELVFRRRDDRMQWLSQVHHRENFGIFANSHFCVSAPIQMRERIKFIQRLTSDPRKVIQGSFWPYYTIYRYAGAPLAWVYKQYRKVQSRRLLRNAPRPGVMG